MNMIFENMVQCIKFLFGLDLLYDDDFILCEIEIVCLVSFGLINKEIVQMFDISYWIVGVYMCWIFFKFKVKCCVVIQYVLIICGVV